jgi:hypothetical protein
MADELFHSHSGDKFLMNNAQNSSESNTGDSDMELDERSDDPSSTTSSDNESGSSSPTSTTNPPGLFSLSPPPERTYYSLVLAEEATHEWSKKHGCEIRKEMDTNTSAKRRRNGPFIVYELVESRLDNKRKLIDARHVRENRVVKRI